MKEREKNDIHNIASVLMIDLFAGPAALEWYGKVWLIFDSLKMFECDNKITSSFDCVCVCVRAAHNYLIPVNAKTVNRTKPNEPTYLPKMG